MDKKTKRKKIEAYVLKIMGVDPSGDNRERYKKFFASLNDKEFGEWIEISHLKTSSAI